MGENSSPASDPAAPKGLSSKGFYGYQYRNIAARYLLCPAQPLILAEGSQMSVSHPEGG